MLWLVDGDDEFDIDSVCSICICFDKLDYMVSIVKFILKVLSIG